ncbi:hypothetical protein MTP02_44380 [Streptomyces albus]|uniref:Uncharacterized protein n=1 Tax=Streptomyces albidoflavus TaxID=1886 RepID=A0AA37FE53_9ACTN|nr:hypothetical protein MTP02_44380 [Streptomyces albus]GHI48485.1 hypothetical protein ScoT_46590 [Streptomyces albidoflavus]
MVVDAGRAAHRLGGVLGADRVDPVVAHAFAHQRGEVVPEGVPGGAREAVAGGVRVDAVPEEDLGPVDVADARDHLLVHEQGGHGGARAGYAAPGGVGGVVGAQRVGAEAVVDGLLVLVGQEGAGGGAAQVRPGVLGGDPEPDGVRGRRRGAGAAGDLAEEAEVDVDPAVAAEVQEEVFAVRLGPGELGAVEQGGGGGEAALGAGDAHRPAAEPLLVVGGQPVEGVPFGHQASCWGWWAGIGGSSPVVS